MFYKVEFPYDDDSRNVQTIESTNWWMMLAKEMSDYGKDDRLGVNDESIFCVSGDVIEFSPGDGGTYTIAKYFKNMADLESFVAGLA